MSEVDVRQLDAYAVERWKDDPDVEIVDAPKDYNPDHGVNTEEEMIVSAESDTD